MFGKIDAFFNIHLSVSKFSRHKTYLLSSLYKIIIKFLRCSDPLQKAQMAQADLKDPEPTSLLAGLAPVPVSTPVLHTGP